MEKTYWWRIAISLGGLFVGLVLLAYDTYFCYAYSKNIYCLSHQFEISVLEPLFFFSISMFVVSLLTFFINDIIFKRWLRFAYIWFVIDLIFIAASPEYQGGWIGIGPEKESVSILMSVLFVILSFSLIAYEKIKEKKIFGSKASK